MAWSCTHHQQTIISQLLSKGHTNKAISQRKILETFRGERESEEWTISKTTTRQKARGLGRRKDGGDMKGESNDSSEIPDRRLTLAIPSLPLGLAFCRRFWYDMIRYDIWYYIIWYGYQVYLGWKPLSGLCQLKLFYLNYQTLRSLRG